MTENRFTQWSEAKTREQSLVDEWKRHVADCTDCCTDRNYSGNGLCEEAQRISDAHRKATEDVKRYSGPFGNPNITRYG